jgi:tetratricopeptide (TPR) repeat protein
MRVGLNSGEVVVRAIGNDLHMDYSAIGQTTHLAARMAQLAAPALVEHGVKQAVARGRPSFLASSIACLSEAYLLAGRLDEAHQHTEQALDLACQYQQRGSQAWALWLLSESTARQASPEVESAAGYYHQALSLAEELGVRPLQAHCHHGLGMLYASAGQQEQARTALSTAIVLYRSMDMRFWLPQAEATLREVAGT